MPAILALLARALGTIFNIVAGLSLLDLAATYAQNRWGDAEDKLAEDIQGQYDTTPEEAATMAVGMGIAALSAKNLTTQQAVAEYVKRGGNAKVANDLLAKRRQISPKVRAQILGDLDRAGVLSSTGGRTAAQLAAGGSGATISLRALLPRLGSIGRVGLFLGKYLSIAAIFSPFLFQQFGDQVTFAPEGLNRYLEFLGIDVRVPVGPAELFGEDDPTQTINQLLNDLRAQGATGINDPFSRSSVPLTAESLNNVLQSLESASTKTFPNEVRVDVLSRLRDILIYRGGLPSGESALPTSSTDGSGGSGKRVIILRMAEESKPEAFRGTLFSGRVGDYAPFERNRLDEITDEQSLRADIVENMNEWLRTLPGRIKYTVSIRKDPVDEFGTEQQGYWATLTMVLHHISGKISPIDTILLGPVPVESHAAVQRVTRTIESELPGMLTGQQVGEVTIPGGAIELRDEAGNRIPFALSPGGGAAAPPSSTGGTTQSGDAGQGAASGNSSQDTAPSGTPPQQPPAQPPQPRKLSAVADLGDFNRNTPYEIWVDGRTMGARGDRQTAINEARQLGDFQGVFDRTRDLEAITTGRPEGQSQFTASRVQNTDGQGLNIRSGPSTSSSVIAALPEGSELQQGEEAKFADGFVWSNVRLQDGREGWAAARFLT